MSKILYVGNDLVKKTNYKTSMALICEKLKIEGLEVFRTSSKTNKLLRILDMCLSVVKHRNSKMIIIDVFSTTNFYYALIVSQLCRFLNIPYSTVLRGGNLPFRLSKSPFLSKLIFNNSLANVAPSKYLEQEFIKHDFKTTYISNTIEISDYDFNEKLLDTPKILWVRAFKTIYNPSMAVEVLKKVKENYPEARLCMVGPQTDHSYQETISLAESYGIQNSIEFTGVLKKKDWVKKSKEYNVFINTTNIDNTPVSVIEAMALGFVVVSTNAGGIPFLIDDKKDGYLVDRNDYNAMSDLIIKLFKKEIAITSVSARNKVETFDWIHVKNSWLQLIASV